MNGKWFGLAQVYHVCGVINLVSFGPPASIYHDRQTERNGADCFDHNGNCIDVALTPLCTTLTLHTRPINKIVVIDRIQSHTNMWNAWKWSVMKWKLPATPNHTNWWKITKRTSVGISNQRREETKTNPIYVLAINIHYIIREAGFPASESHSDCNEFAINVKILFPAKQLKSQAHCRLILQCNEVYMKMKKKRDIFQWTFWLHVKVMEGI